jgi:hypothetical protein
VAKPKLSLKALTPKPWCPGMTLTFELLFDQKGGGPDPEHKHVELWCSQFLHKQDVEVKPKKTKQQVQVELAPITGTAELRVTGRNGGACAYDVTRAPESIEVRPFQVVIESIEPPGPYLQGQEAKVTLKVLPVKAPKRITVALVGMVLNDKHVVKIQDVEAVTVSFPKAYREEQRFWLQVADSSLQVATTGVAGGRWCHNVLVPTARQWKKRGKKVKDLKKWFTGQELSASGHVFSAKDLKAAGFKLPALRAARCRISELKALNYTAANLKKAGFSCRELRTGFYDDVMRKKLETFWGSEELAAGDGLKAFGNPTVLGLDEDERYKPLYTAAEVKAAKFTVAEAFHAGYPDDQLLEAKYVLPKPGYELDLKANQVALVRDDQDGKDTTDIRQLRDAYVEASMAMYSERRKKQVWKKDHAEVLTDSTWRAYFRRSTLTVLKDELEKEKAKGKTVGKRRVNIDAELRAIDAMIEQKQTLHKAYKDAKHKLVEAVDVRTKYLKKQRDQISSRLEGELKTLDAVCAQRREKLAAINKQLSKLPYLTAQRPSGTDSPHEIAAAEMFRKYDELLRLRDALLGPDLSHKSELERTQLFKDLAGRKVDRETSDGLLILEEQRRRLSWNVEQFKAELDALAQIKKLTEQVHRQWDMVTKIHSVFPKLLKKAKEVTTVVLGAPLLKKHESLSKRIPRNITGSSQFAFSIEINTGGDAVVASAKLGLGLAYAAALRVDDDRRVRSTSSLHLVPSLKASLGPEAAPAAEAALKLGLTLWNKTETFIDERHYAYVKSFRVANLLRLLHRFTQYGNAWTGRNYNQFFELYDPELKKILEAMLGKEQEGEYKGEYEEMEYYLRQPVIEVAAKKAGSVSAEVAASGPGGTGVTFNESVTGLVFTKTTLDISDPERPSLLKHRREGRVLAASGGAEVSWEFGAKEDGSSFCPISVAVAGTQIENEANPDNDGNYLNVKCSLGSWLPFDPKDLCPNMALVSRKTLQTAVDKLRSGGGGAAAMLKRRWENLDPVVDKQMGSNLIVEHNFVSSEGRWRRQYRRYVYHNKLGAEVGISSGPWIGGIATGVDVSFAKEQTITLYENLGANTLTYLQTVYNGLRERWVDAAQRSWTPGGSPGRSRQRRSSQWDDYLELHKCEVWELLKAIGDPEAKGRAAGARAEAEALDAKLNEHAKLWADDAPPPPLPVHEEEIFGHTEEHVDWQGDHGWIGSLALTDDDVKAHTHDLLTRSSLMTLDRSFPWRGGVPNLTREIVSWVVRHELKISSDPTTSDGAPRILWLEPSDDWEAEAGVVLTGDPRLAASGCLDHAISEDVYDVILMPLNGDLGHWSLLAYFKATAAHSPRSSLVHFDPGHGYARVVPPPREQAGCVIDFLRGHDPKHGTVHFGRFLSEVRTADDAEPPTGLLPKQTGADDCGALLLLLVKAIQERVRAGNLEAPAPGELDAVTDAAAAALRTDLLARLRDELVNAEATAPGEVDTAASSEPTGAAPMAAPAPADRGTSASGSGGGRTSAFAALCEQKHAAIDIRPDLKRWRDFPELAYLQKKAANQLPEEVKGYFSGTPSPYDAFLEDDGAVAAYETLRDAMTEAFERESKIRDYQQPLLWKRTRSCLIADNGKLVVNVDFQRWHDGLRPHVALPPKLEQVSVADVWRDRALRDAEDLRPFYRCFYEIELVLQAPAGGALSFETRAPDGLFDLSDLLETLLRAMFAGKSTSGVKQTLKRAAPSWWTGEPKRKAHQLECLLRLHPKLWEALGPWFQAQASAGKMGKVSPGQIEELIQEFRDRLDAWAAEVEGDPFEAILARLKGPFTSFRVGSVESTFRKGKRVLRHYR